MSNVSDILDTTITKKENPNEPAQIKIMKKEKNQLVSLKALKATSKNVEKQLKIIQEMCSIINLKKRAGLTIKQKATQECLIERKRIKA